ncbi:hypothetical protein BUALT_Bualt14G0049000 [Buddleja alternifolia]|uniref:B3 domain-containing protein n=1 Tax=Buddleja alternifolia TaxID=168488 RepID=A0AAV6WMX2_9LAMI|nr:hypothetical protein BUALT_Bualt14G0049000 [Buddleja alternifolia]
MAAEEEDWDERDPEDEDFVVRNREENEKDDDQGEQVMDDNEQDDDLGEQVVGKQLADAGGAAKKSRARKKRTTDWYDAELFRSGRVRQPTNPYFFTAAHECRTIELYIPKAVVNLYKLELLRERVLVDEEGREFPSKRKVWTDGRVNYIEGWKTFCSLIERGGYRRQVYM